MHSMMIPERTRYEKWYSPVPSHTHFSLLKCFSSGNSLIDKDYIESKILLSLLSVQKLPKSVHYKWTILSRTGKIGSGKNTKYFFFVLVLMYTFRTCFESKNFLSNSCPVLSNQVLSSSACHIY